MTNEDNSLSGSQGPLTNLPFENNINNSFPFLQGSHDDGLSIMPGQHEKDALVLLSDEARSESHLS